MTEALRLLPVPYRPGSASISGSTQAGARADDRVAPVHRIDPTARAGADEARGKPAILARDDRFAGFSAARPSLADAATAIDAQRIGHDMAGDMRLAARGAVYAYRSAAEITVEYARPQPPVDLRI